MAETLAGYGDGGLYARSENSFNTSIHNDTRLEIADLKEQVLVDGFNNTKDAVVQDTILTAEKARDIAKFVLDQATRHPRIATLLLVPAAALACRWPGTGQAVQPYELQTYISQYPNEAIWTLVQWGAGIRGGLSAVENALNTFTGKPQKPGHVIGDILFETAAGAFEGAALGTLVEENFMGIDPSRIRLLADLATGGTVFDFVGGAVREFGEHFNKLVPEEEHAAH